MQRLFLTALSVELRRRGTDGRLVAAVATAGACNARPGPATRALLGLARAVAPLARRTRLRRRLHALGYLLRLLPGKEPRSPAWYAPLLGTRSVGQSRQVEA